MNSGDLSSAVLLSIVESVSGNSLGSLVRDKLDGLDNTLDNLPSVWIMTARRNQGVSGETTHLVLDTRVLSLGVFSDQDLISAPVQIPSPNTHSVDIVIRSLVSFYGDTRSDIGKQ